MKTTTISGLVAGLLMILASFTMPSAKVPSLASASPADLASVYGMDYQGTPGQVRPPHTWLGLVCQQYGGTPCDEGSGGLPMFYCSGLWPDAGPCGGAEGLHCRRKINGPSNNDACTTAGAHDNDRCTLHYDGYCVKYETGHCKTDPVLLNCYCDYTSSGTFTSGVREYCM